MHRSVVLSCTRRPRPRTYYWRTRDETTTRLHFRFPPHDLTSAVPSRCAQVRPSLLQILASRPVVLGLGKKLWRAWVERTPRRLGWAVYINGGSVVELRIVVLTFSCKKSDAVLLRSSPSFTCCQASCLRVGARMRIRLHLPLCSTETRLAQVPHCHVKYAAPTEHCNGGCTVVDRVEIGAPTFRFTFRVWALTLSCSSLPTFQLSARDISSVLYEKHS